MGYNSNSGGIDSHEKKRKVFLVTNYGLLAAASSCIFLTLSLRLIPSLCGFFFICLHLLTAGGALAGCAAASGGADRWYGAQMICTVLTAIFQGSVSVLIFTSSDQFLGKLKSYVREDDAVKILKLVGGLCAVIFCLEWLVLVLAFFLKYYAYVESASDGRSSAKVVQGEENVGNWPPFKVQV